MLNSLKFNCFDVIEGKFLVLSVFEAHPSRPSFNHVKTKRERPIDLNWAKLCCLRVKELTSVCKHLLCRKTSVITVAVDVAVAVRLLLRSTMSSIVTTVITFYRREEEYPIFYSV